MQGFERVDRQLTDVAALAGHLIPAGSMFAFLAGHRAEVFPDADYASGSTAGTASPCQSHDSSVPDAAPGVAVRIGSGDLVRVSRQGL